MKHSGKFWSKENIFDNGVHINRFGNYLFEHIKTYIKDLREQMQLIQHENFSSVKSGDGNLIAIK